MNDSEVEITRSDSEGPIEELPVPARRAGVILKAKQSIVLGRLRLGIWVQTQTRRLRDWAADSCRALERRVRGNSPSVALVPMAAEYREEDHGEYVALIMEALVGYHSQNIHNIALSGGYGVGKSSILTEVADRCGRRVVKISLSTLASTGESTRPNSGADASKGPTDTTTNRIQKEIVKQLLYSESPSKTSGSRYRRRSVRKWWQGAPIPAAAIITAVGYFSDFTLKTIAPKLWHVKLPAAFSALNPFLSHLSIFLVTFIALHLLTKSLRYSLSIEKLSASAGPAGISLAKPSDTYFDEYLDEIVYYFESTKKDIVIFEDIDRFNDPHIFGALRALNTLLNEAAQLSARNIRFIYALKDSIFEELQRVKLSGATGEQSAGDRASQVDRTKFFDLVVPVVPFVTHRSARDLMLEVMEGQSHNVSTQLINLVARHLPDMRSIKNVGNEFLVFRGRILNNKGGNLLGLSEDKLFAMMLYKCAHLTDFERILSAESALDLLYGDYRDLVSQNLAALDVAERNTQELLTAVRAVDSRAAAFGTSLRAYIDGVVKHVRQTAETTWKLSLEGQEYENEALTTPRFWRDYLASDKGLRVTLDPPLPGSIVLKIERPDLEAALGRPLEEAKWQQEDAAQHSAELERIRKLRAFLGHAEMHDLVSRNELKVQVQNEVRTFEDQIHVRLASPLARELVESGHIDRYFTLYCSIYHGNHVSPAAMNFILHCVDPDRPDINFELSPSEVDAVLAERGEVATGQRGMYNIRVLEQLVDTKGSALSGMLNAIMRFENEEQQFLLACLERSAKRVEVILALTAVWPKVLTFLAGDNPLGDELRLELFNASLGEIQPGIAYEVNDDVAGFLEAQYNALAILKLEALSADRASEIARVFSLAGVYAPSLLDLAAPLRRALIDAGFYEINRSNLIEALGLQTTPTEELVGTDPGEEAAGDVQSALREPAQLCLEAIKDASATAYNSVLRDLEGYLGVVESEEGAHTVESVGSFGKILDDLHEQTGAHIFRVVTLSSPECIIQRIATVHERAWSALATHKRFPATFENINDYILNLGIDEALASFLQVVNAIEGAESANEEAKQRIANALAAARTEILRAEHRAELIVSLDMEGYLPIESLEKVDGPLVGWLIDKVIIKDSPESLTLIPENDWGGREFAISKSRAFPDYVTPSVLPEGEVEQLMQSKLIPDVSKEAILNRLSEFTPTPAKGALSAAAFYATQNGKIVPASEIMQMASIVNSNLIVRALLPHLANLSRQELVVLLLAMGGEYAKLTDTNGKRPKIPGGRGSVELLVRLKELGLVATYHGPQKGVITVNMRRT